VHAKQLTILLAVVLIGGVLAVHFVVPALESDHGKLQRFTAHRVAEARRLLAEYNHNYQALAPSAHKLTAAGLELPAPAPKLQHDISKNDDRLQQAVTLLQQAVQYQVGSASGSELIEPNQLLGQVLRHQAGNLRTQALARRTQAQTLRFQALQLIHPARAAAAEANALTHAQPDPVIQQLTRQLAALSHRADQAQQQADALQAQVDRLHAKITPLRAAAKQARTELARLDAHPPDPADGAAVNRYRRIYADLAKTARQAEYQADALQSGCLAGATLDQTHGGDLTVDNYVGGTLKVGLTTLKARLATARARADGLSQAVAVLEQRQTQLHQAQTDLQQQRATAQTLLQQRVTQLKTLLDQTAKSTAEAESIENDALAKLSSARTAFSAAGRAAKARNQSASRQLSTAKDRKNPRLEKLAADRSWEADAYAALADVFALQAEVYLQRVLDSQEQRLLLEESIETLGHTQSAVVAELSQALSATEVKLAKDRQAGLDSLDNPDSQDNVIGHLTRLKRVLSGMRAKRAWTADALAGRAWYLVAQLADDDQTRGDATGKAIEVLVEALKGPGDQPRSDSDAQPFAELLSYLKGRQGSVLENSSS